MKTIEERAKEYGSKKADIYLSPIYNEALAGIDDMEHQVDNPF